MLQLIGQDDSAGRVQFVVVVARVTGPGGQDATDGLVLQGARALRLVEHGQVFEPGLHWAPPETHFWKTKIKFLNLIQIKLLEIKLFNFLEFFFLYFLGSDLHKFA